MGKKRFRAFAKGLVSIVFSVALTFSLVPAMAFAAAGDSVDSSDAIAQTGGGDSPSVQADEPDDPDPYSGGTGTQDDPYLISTAQDLQEMATQVANNITYANTYFKVTNDIDLSDVCYRLTGEITVDKSWTPIGQSSSNKFCGIFDGAGHTISNMYINTKSEKAGLFGFVQDGAQILNLTVTGNIKTATDWAGGIIGQSVVNDRENPVVIKNVRSEVNIESTASKVGGIIGEGQYRTVIENCVNTGNLTMSKATNQPRVGGIVGYAYGGNQGFVIKNCYNTGNVTARSDARFVGGLAGYFYASAYKVEVVNNYNVGTISHSTNSQANAGIMGYANLPTSNLVFENNYYLDTSASSAGTYNISSATPTALSEKEMKAADFPGILNAQAFEYLEGSYPSLFWEGKGGSAIITEHPQDAVYEQGADAESLKVEAQLPTSGKVGADGKLSYQWYTTNANGEDVAIPDATGKTYTPSTKELGDYSYWCVVTNTFGSKITKVTSAKAAITVNLVKTVIKPELKVCADKTIKYGETLEENPLTVEVTNNTGDGAGALSYQWYTTTSKTDNQNGTKISSATNKEYAPKLTDPGTTYYYCVVSNTFTNGAGKEEVATTTSNVVAVNNEAETLSIGTADELIAFATAVNSGLTYKGIDVKLTADIALSGNWTPIGNASVQFQGNFDGQYHTISGLSIDTTAQYAGLFGYIKNATIKNLTVEGSVKSTQFYVGGIVARAGYDTKDSDHKTIIPVLENLKNNADVTTTQQEIGGIVGYISGDDIAIKNCVNNGNISASVGPGGIIGHASKTVSIINCYNTGAISVTGSVSSDWAGGIAGNFQAEPVLVKNCFNTGKVKDGTGSMFGYVSIEYDADYMDFANNYYLEGTCETVVAKSSSTNTAARLASVEALGFATKAKSAAWFASADATTALGSAYAQGTAVPMLAWEAALTGAPVITTQPKAGTSKVGEAASALTVKAELIPGFAFSNGTLSYQWYRNAWKTTIGAEKINGATEASYTPDNKTASSYYYYCVVTNTWQEGGAEKSASVNSALAGYAVQSNDEAVAPVIAEQPKDVQVDYMQAAKLDIAANVDAGKGIVSYQWYSNDKKSTEGATLLKGETESTYIPSTDATGTKYYYCVVTNTFEMTKTAKVTSDIVAVNVSDKMFINSLDEFLAFRKTVNEGNRFIGITVKLCTDLDLSTVCGPELGNWEPIGSMSDSQGKYAFAGTFDGAYHTIKGLYIKVSGSGTASKYRGLFGGLSNKGTGVAAQTKCGIRNLTVEGDCTFDSSSSYSGGVVASIAGNGSTQTCFLENVCSKVNVSTNTSGSYAGNVTGEMKYTNVTNCVNNGTIATSQKLSMLYNLSPFGYADSGTTLTNCYSLAKYAMQSSSGNARYYNGTSVLVGGNPTSVTNCYAGGDFSENSCLGMYAYNFNGYKTTNCYYQNDNITKDSSGATGKSIADMKDATFVTALGEGYVADTGINDGYPILKWQAGIGQGAPTITAQPQGRVYSETDTSVEAITIEAALPGKGEIGSQGTLGYQWYSNTAKSNEGGTLINGADKASYTPSIENGKGTTYYYCVVTNTFDEARAVSVTSDPCAIIVVEGDLVAPIISTQPQAITLVQNMPAKELSVEATLDSGSLAYQWYKGTKADGSDLSIIANATKATYAPETSESGIFYYACAVSSTFDNTVAKTTFTDTVAVKVIANSNNGAAIIEGELQNVPSDVVAGDAIEALKVTATLPETDTLGADGTLHYQWYHNTTGTVDVAKDEKVGTDSASYTPEVTAETQAGYHYYYCVVSNEFTIGSDTATSAATVNTNVARMHVVTEKQASAPVIVSQPQMTFNEQGTSSPAALSVEIDPDQMDNVGTITYQWYACVSYKDSKRFNAIANATTDTYTPQSSTLGSCYYFCRITNTFEDVKVAYTDSNVVRVFTWNEEEATPIINVQPVGGAQYVKGETANALKVEASIPEAYTPSNYKATLHYQWYRNTTGEVDMSTDAKVGTDSPTYVPDTNLASAYYYYYCVVTNKFQTKTPVATHEVIATSDIVRIAIVSETPAATPTVKTIAMDDDSYAQMNYPSVGEKATALKVEGAVEGAGAGTLSYQWYYSTSSTCDPSVDTKVEGATKATYNPDLGLSANTRYYYCVVTNTFENVKTATAISQPAKIDLTNIVILSAQELYNFAVASNKVDGTAVFEGCTVELANDIDLSDYANWPGICNATNMKYFAGTFDGKGHTVSGMTINSNAKGYNQSSYKGFFSQVGSATIKNLTVKGSIDMATGTSYTGGIAGTVQYINNTENKAVFENIVSDVNISVSSMVQEIGGIAGDVNIANARFTNCAFKGSIDVSATPSAPRNCYYGGIVGVAGSMLQIARYENCYNAGIIRASGFVAGIASSKQKTDIKYTNCFNVGQLTGLTSANYTGAYAIAADYSGKSSPNPGSESLINCHFLKGTASSGNNYIYGDGGVITYDTLEDMNSDSFLSTINASGNAFKLGTTYPVFNFEQGAGVPVITAQPKADMWATQGEEAAALTVTASTPAEPDPGNDGTLSYQWFKGTKADGSDAKAVADTADEEANSIVPDTTQAGTFYYFCRVFNDYGATPLPSVDSSIVKFTVLDDVEAATPVITAQPTSANYKAGDEIDMLNVKASVSGAGAGKLSYQWYRSLTPSTAQGVAISGATTKSCNPEVNSGTYYYYCVVTNTYQGKKTASVTSDFAKISVGADVQIKSLAEFVAFRDAVNAGDKFAGKTVELMCDLDLSSIDNWIPIGADATNYFSGSFNGNGHSITGLNIERTGSNVGLFGTVQAVDKTVDVIIENLSVAGSVSSDGSYVAGLVGYLSNSSSANCVAVRNIETNVRVKAKSYAAGVVGCARTHVTEISSCVNRGTISIDSTASYAAGIVAWYQTFESTLTGVYGCYNVGKISGGNALAGIVGQTATNVTNCYNAGEVLGTNSDAVAGSSSTSNSFAYANNLYLDTSCADGQNNNVADAVTSDQLKSADALAKLNADKPCFKEGNEYPVLTFEQTGVGAPVIKTQPSDSWGPKDGNVTRPLKVEAALPTKEPSSKGTLSYQWYKLVNNEGVAIDNATDATYAPDVAELGADKYYVVVTNTWDGGKLSVKSNTVTFTVADVTEPATPTITTQPKSASVNQYVAAKPLSVEASVEGEGAGDLSYQWYECDKDGNNAKVIEEQTGTTYTPATTNLGTKYYFCRVTNTFQTVKKATIDTDIASVEVKQFSINTAQDLADFRDAVNAGATFAGATVTLNDDIDLSEVCGPEKGSWTPIGTSTTYKFAGIFDGQGHTISNLYINGTTTYQGLFGLAGGTGAGLRNFTVKGDVVSTRYAAGVVSCIIGGSANSPFVIENVISEVNVQGDRAATGIGYQADSLYTVIKSCTNKGKITGARATSTMPVAGIVSARTSPSNLTVTDCYNSGEVTTTATTTDRYVAGISNGAKSVKNCLNVGYVHASAESAYVAAIDSHSSLVTEASNNYYLDTSCAKGMASTAVEAPVAKTATELADASFVAILNNGGNAWQAGNGHPILACEPNPSLPTITKQPTSLWTTQGAKDVTLSVEATAPSGAFAGTLTYQWYKVGLLVDSAIDNATSSTLTIDTSVMGTDSYYCKVTNTYADGTSSVTSKTAEVKVLSADNAATPTITLKSDKQLYVAKDAEASLEIEANVANPGAGVLSYQWFVATDKDLSDLTAIENATDKTYALDTSVEGKAFYVCKVTNTFEEVKNATAQSDAIEVAVISQTKADAQEKIEQAANDVKANLTTDKLTHLTADEVKSFVDQVETVKADAVKAIADATETDVDSVLNTNLDAINKVKTDADKANLTASEKETQDANNKAAEIQKKLDVANADLAKANEELATAKASLASTKADLDKANASLEKAQKDYDALKGAKDATDAELAQAKSDLSAAKAAQAAAEAAKAEAEAAQAKAEAAQKQAEADKAKAEEEAAQAKADKEAAKEAQAKAEEAQKAAEAAQAKAEEAQKVAEAAQAKAEEEAKLANEARDEAIKAVKAAEDAAKARLKAGKQMVIGSYIYTVLSGSTTVSVKCAYPSIKKAVIASTVKDTAGNVYRVTQIAKNGFANCAKLTKVSGGKYITAVGSKAFNGCSKLKTVTISSAYLTTIGSKAFYKTSKLTKITINKTSKLKTVKNAFKSAGKSSGKKLTVKVKSSKKKAYKKLITKKGGNKKLKVK